MLTFSGRVIFDKPGVQRWLGPHWQRYVETYEADLNRFRPQFEAVPDTVFLFKPVRNTLSRTLNEVVTARSEQDPTAQPRIFRLGGCWIPFETRDGFYRRILHATDPNDQDPNPAGTPVRRLLRTLQRTITG